MKILTEILGKWLQPLGSDFPPLYMVGGSVRDCLLSRTPKDIDLMCDDAEAVARKLADANHAAFVPFLKKPEEPCYRVANRKNPDDFLDVSPIRGGTVLADLGRRDFTINAIAMRIGPNGAPGDIIDPTDGAGDLKRKIIRITNPKVFSSDPLRIMRAFRFSAILGFDIEESTIRAIETHAAMLPRVSFERILQELILFLKSKNVCPLVRMADRLGVLETVFPEIGPMKNCGQNTYHHLDVWEHSLTVLENLETVLGRPADFFGNAGPQVEENLAAGNRTAILKLAAILHDCAKPETREIKDTGRITFYGHNKAGGHIADNIGRRLRMSNPDREFLTFLVSEHMQPLFLNKPNVRPETIAKWFRKGGRDAIAVIIHGMADIMSVRGPESSREFRENHLRWSKETINSFYESIKPRLEEKSLISGGDLIAMGMEPGPEMGRLLNRIREAQDAGVITEKHEAMNLAREQLGESDRQPING